MVSMISQWILTLLIFFPLLGAVVVGLMKDAQQARHVAVAIAVLEMIFSFHLLYIQLFCGKLRGLF